MAPEQAGSDKAARLESLRKKIAKINRQPVPPSPDGIVFRRDLPHIDPARRPITQGVCVPLDECVSGRECHDCAGPPFYLVERSVVDLEPESAQLTARLRSALKVLAERDAVNGTGPVATPLENVCFLDLETTGLGSTPVFLIGTLVVRGGDLVCRQLLARTYAEEASILDHFARTCRETHMFVTFNGKTFDVPYVRTRSAATGVPFVEVEGHLDLLHAARRAYKDALPNCQLQTLERHVCRRHRGLDIPGARIPQAYHDFVRTGDAREVAQVMEHNLRDLVTLADLMTRIFVTHENADER